MAQVAKREANRTQFRCVITKLTEAGRFPESDADEAEKQYGDFIDNVAVKHRAEFATFDTNTGRVEPHGSPQQLLLDIVRCCETGLASITWPLPSIC